MSKSFKQMSKNVFVQILIFQWKKKKKKKPKLHIICISHLQNYSGHRPGFWEEILAQENYLLDAQKH